MVVGGSQVDVIGGFFVVDLVVVDGGLFEVDFVDFAVVFGGSKSGGFLIDKTVQIVNSKIK